MVASARLNQGKFASYLVLFHISEKRLCGVFTQIAQKNNAHMMGHLKYCDDIIEKQNCFSCHH